MKLYYQTHSPYARKVLVLIHELGILGQVQVNHYETSPTAENLDVYSKNPLGKVPILVHNEQTLFDSAVIAKYLIDSFNLLNAQKSNDVKLTLDLQNLQLEALATGIADAGILARWELERRPENKRYEPFLEGQLLKLAQSYDYLEELKLMAQEQTVSYGELALACSLAWIEYVGLPDFKKDRPKLARWYLSFCERASMKATSYSGATID